MRPAAPDAPAGPVPAGVAPLRIALISCGKTKTAHPSPVRDLYTGPLFRSARQYVEAATAAGRYTAWYVLSARHYVLHPDTILAPYDLTMTDRDADGTRQWAIHVDTDIRCDHGYGTWLEAGGEVEVDVYAGAAYVDPLMALWRSRGRLGPESKFRINDPHHGLELGQRRQAFRLALEGLTREEPAHV